VQDGADGDWEGEDFRHVSVDSHVVHRGERSGEEEGVPVREVDGVLLVLKP
jgi:hypothetical protein